jgi:hypothetical protein
MTWSPRLAVGPAGQGSGKISPQPASQVRHRDLAQLADGQSRWPGDFAKDRPGLII